MTEPTAPEGASSFPPIPIPDSADVPEVVRERHDEPERPEVTPTYPTPDFRMWPPTTVTGPDGKPVAMVLYEELDPESGRWEPFYTVRVLTDRAGKHS